MACWMALSEDQQTFMIEKGYLEIGYRPEGTRCDRGAQVAIETEHDTAPGPRFYCVPCAIEYLASLEKPSA